MADGSKLSVILPRGFHPFPSRTRKLSPAGPMVLHAKVCGRVGRCRHKTKATFRYERGLFRLASHSLLSVRSLLLTKPLNRCIYWIVGKAETREEN